MKTIEELLEISKIPNLKYHSLETASIYLNIHPDELVKLQRKELIQTIAHNGELLFTTESLDEFMKTAIYKNLQSFYSNNINKKRQKLIIRKKISF